MAPPHHLEGFELGNAADTTAPYRAAAGAEVVEVNRPNRQVCRRRGKTDTADAEAAPSASPDDTVVCAPKSADGAVEAVRVEHDHHILLREGPT